MVLRWPALQRAPFQICPSSSSRVAFALLPPTCRPVPSSSQSPIASKPCSTPCTARPTLTLPDGKKSPGRSRGNFGPVHSGRRRRCCRRSRRRRISRSIRWRRSIATTGCEGEGRKGRHGGKAQILHFNLYALSRSLERSRRCEASNKASFWLIWGHLAAMTVCLRHTAVPQPR